MRVFTDFWAFQSSTLNDDPVAKLQTMGSTIAPVESRLTPTTGVQDSDPEKGLDDAGAPSKKFGAPRLNVQHRGPTADSTPLQIWEGTVLDVDKTAQVMHVILDAKMDETPRHTGEIDLEWVAEQDRDLVRPGAVFYLTLFKRTTKGSVQNAQELRFRRRPAWSRAQIKQIERDAAMLHAKMKPARTAP